MRKLWKIMPATLVLAILSGGCESAQRMFEARKPTARLMGLAFGDVNLDSATLLFDVEIRNPYSVALPVTGLDYGVTVEGGKFLSGQTDIAAAVPAQSTQVVSLPTTVSYADVLKAAKGVRPGGTIAYTARADMAVDAPILGPIRLPLSREAEITLPTTSGTAVRQMLENMK